MFQKVYDRLTGMLGRDCQGKPLRRGDRVMVVGPEVKPEVLGMVTRVVDGWQPTDPAVIAAFGVNGWVEVESRPRCPRYGQCKDLVRLDDGDEASWRHVADATGWMPHSVPQRDEVVA